MKNVAIIIPCYNEQDNIVKLIKIIKYFLPKVCIYIIDDSVGLETSFLISKKKINYYHRAKKLGRGSAVIYGLKKALLNKKVRIFIEMDADFSHNPKELKRNINLFKKNKLDLLVSSRYLKNSQIINWPLSRKVLSFLANYLAKKILKLPLSDYTNGFRIYSKRSAYRITKECGKIGDGFIVLSEILLQLFKSNYKIYETSTIFHNRLRGESSVSLKLIFNSFTGLLKLYYIKVKYLKTK
jgi:dolichol-phosphate mannosyltransferase